jgi:predicted transglutaminase-like cysteine proteinase
MLRIWGKRAGLAVGIMIMGLPGAAKAAPEKPVEKRQYAYAAVGEDARPPIGWVMFCREYKSECRNENTEARDVVLSQTAWNDLVKINRWVNEHIKPLTDMDHWNVVEKWDLPNDGYGDCEDYVLLKRKMLIEAGWPRQALLITVVRDKKGDGHAVLTVKTDKGEYVLDNQAEEVLHWTDSGYRFVKRQSQLNEQTWVSLGDVRPAIATASSRRPGN